ncbi:MAG: hypothetical protein RI897_1536 [Verrucomicrobiota bacterium]|jgi:subtilisin family serine protease
MFNKSIFTGLTLLVSMIGLQAVEVSPVINLNGREAHPTRILARFKNAADAQKAETATLLEAEGVVIKHQYGIVPGLVVLDTPAIQVGNQTVSELSARIWALRQSGLFQYVEPNYVGRLSAEPNDAYYVNGDLWGLKNVGGNGGTQGTDISAPEAWDLTTGSTNVIVAVLDSGVRYTHQDLAKQMWVNPGESGLDADGLDKATNGVDDDGNGIVDDVHGINALDVTAVLGDPDDLNGHGTHVAGTIGAAANDGSPHVGVAWKVQLMACVMGDANGFVYYDSAIASMEYAATNGARVINASWGGTTYSSPLYDAIDKIRQNGVLFVAAAGNSAEDNDVTPHYPSSYELDNVIAVAAIDRADRLAAFSCFGLTSVDLGAPGHEILSTWNISDTAYNSISGTSMAAPHVTGVAALILAHNPAADLFEMRQRLLETVVKTPALDGITVTGGRVNAYKALTASGDGDLEISVNPAEEAVLLSGSTQQVFVAVSDLFGVTDATVVGQFVSGASGALNFTNDGNPPDAVAGDSIYSAEFVVPALAPPDEYILCEIGANAPDKIGVTNVVRWYVADPPTNDNFADAAKVPAEGRVTYSLNKFATLELPDEPQHSGVATVAASLWWVWSPSYDNHVVIDTAGSDIDTVIGVYTGKTLANLTEVASGDNVAGRAQAYVEFDAERGVSYYIAVAGATSDDTGSIRFRVEPDGRPDTLPPIVQILEPANGAVVTSEKITISGIAADPKPASGVFGVSVQNQGDLMWKRASGSTNWNVSLLLKQGYNTISATAVDYARNTAVPVSIVVQYMPLTTPNDHFVNALELEGSNGQVGAGNESATKEYLEPFHGGNQGGKSVWYRWTAPADGVLTVATTNNTYDTILGAYTGTVVTNLTTVAGNDDAELGVSASRVSVGVMTGVEYHIAVDGFAGGNGEAELVYEFVEGAALRLETIAGENGRVSPESGDYSVGSVVTVTALPDPGYVFEGWTGTIRSSANPVEITMDQPYTLIASFIRPSISDDFESGSFNPELAYNRNPPGSSAAWSVVQGNAGGGDYSARSGHIADNQQSILLLEGRMVAGVASFQYRVSSEASFDVLEFRVNGEVKRTWSGQNDWTLYQFVVPEGTNKLEWIYRKDPSLSNGEDAVFIDNLEVPVYRPAPEEASALQMLSMPAQGGITVMLTGEPGRRYAVEVSSDLQTWNTVDTVTALSNGSVKYTDLQGPQQSARYYRARGL